MSVHQIGNNLPNYIPIFSDNKVRSNFYKFRREVDNIFVQYKAEISNKITRNPDSPNYSKQIQHKVSEFEKNAENAISRYFRNFNHDRHFAIKELNDFLGLYKHRNYTLEQFAKVVRGILGIAAGLGMIFLGLAAIFLSLISGGLGGIMMGGVIDSGGAMFIPIAIDTVWSVCFPSKKDCMNKEIAILDNINHQTAEKIKTSLEKFCLPIENKDIPFAPESSMLMTP